MEDVLLISLEDAESITEVLSISRVKPFWGSVVSVPYGGGIIYLSLTGIVLVYASYLTIFVTVVSPILLFL